MSRPLVYGALSLVTLVVSAALGFFLLGPGGAVLVGVSGLIVLFATYGGVTDGPEPTPERRPSERGEN